MKRLQSLDFFRGITIASMIIVNDPGISIGLPAKFVSLDWAIFYEFDLSKNITIYRERISKRAAYIKAMEINYSS